MSNANNHIHTCSYHCHRPECIKAQRDQMREWIMDTLGAEKFTEMMAYIIPQSTTARAEAAREEG